MNAPSGLLNPIQWFVDVINGTGRGKPVSGNDAISTAPMWYAVGKIAGHVGMLPLNVHRRTAAGSEKDLLHPGAKLMRVRPNAYQIPMVFRELIQTHALLWGNGRAYIVRDSQGRPIELIPLLPDRTYTVAHEGEKWHVTRPIEEDRLIEMSEDWKAENLVVMHDEEVLHIPGLGFDGFNGKSLLQVARESINIGVQGDRRASTQMQKGFAAQLMLEAPEGVFRNEQEAQKFLTHFRASHEADKDAEKIGMLREGMKAHIMNMSNKDAEFLESRKFQREEVALWLGIETMPGTGNDSYNSLEQRNLAYLSTCLQKWLTKWEQECDAKLLSDRQRDRGTHYFRFNVATLLRTDLQTTINSMGNAISNRIMNPNEAREKLDMNAYPGGDAFENPAITPGAPGSTDESSDDRTQVADQSPANRAAVVAHLEHMLGVEENRVNEMLTRGDSLEKITVWYTGWQSRLSDNIEKLGGSSEIAARHCQQNLAFINKNPNRPFSLLGTAELLAKEIEDETV